MVVRTWSGGRDVRESFLDWTWVGAVGMVSGVGCLVAGRELVTLLVDQLVEPADLPVGALQAQLVQLGGVGVESLGSTGHRCPQAFSSFLDPPSTALQDSHPGLG